MEFIPYFLVFIYGLAWGSYATSAISRIPAGKSWLGNSPHCGKCKAKLTFVDYCSLFSYLILKGKCRHCGVKYPNGKVYFLAELLITLSCLYIYHINGIGDKFLILTLISINLIVLLFIAYLNKILPSTALVSLTILVIIFALMESKGDIFPPFFGAFFMSVLSIMARELYFLFKRKKHKIGEYLKFGDKNPFDSDGFEFIKFASIAGIILPLNLIFIFIGYSIIFFGIFRITRVKYDICAIVAALLITVHLL